MTASAEVTIEWNAVSRARYVRLTKTAGRSALEQSWDFGETVAAHHGQRTDRAVLTADGKPPQVVTLEAQACNDEICLLPETVTLNIPPVKASALKPAKCM